MTMIYNDNENRHQISVLFVGRDDIGHSRVIRALSWFRTSVHLIIWRVNKRSFLSVYNMLKGPNEAICQICFEMKLAV